MGNNISKLAEDIEDIYDPRYQNGKIYTITCEDGEVYVGSTILSLNKRLIVHKSANNCSMYQYIHNNYDGYWKKCKIELYENYPCDNRKELNKKEGEIIRLIATINKVIAGRTKDNYYKDNKEILIEKQKKIYNPNQLTLLDSIQTNNI